MPTKKMKTRVHRHTFVLEDEFGLKYKLPTIVKQGNKPVEFLLTADHVRASIDRGGVGNTACCSIACSANEQKAAFPHPVVGYIDWQYSRCFVASKRNQKTGQLTECVTYEHSFGHIAKLNDSEGGQKKLLAMIEKDGPMKIILRPSRDRSKERIEPGKPTGRSDGSRSQRISLGKGAKLRRAFAARGGVA